MKIRFSTNAAAIVAVFIALYAFEASGQQTTVVVPPGLPTSLPIGSQHRIMEWAVTNCVASTDLRDWYTNTAGIFEYTGNMSGYKWVSYDAWKQFTLSNAFYSFVHSHSPISPSSEVIMLINVAYIDDGPISFYPNIMIINTNIGLASSITSNSFANAMAGAIPTNLVDIIIVSNLSQYQVIVGSYNYTWSASTGQAKPNSVPGYPPELTTNNTAIPSLWYSKGTNDCRIRLTLTNGQTMWYTGDGDPLLPGTVSISPDALSVTVLIPSGSDTILQSSADLVHWMSVTNLSWSLHTNMVIIPTSIKSPACFYRTITK